jgi:hypothetical protein
MGNASGTEYVDYVQRTTNIWGWLTSSSSYAMTWNLSNNNVTFGESGGNVGIGSTSPVSSLDISQKTDALALPAGTTGQRPTGVNGMVRYNSTVPQLEGYINGAWAGLATGSSGTITLGTSASVTNPQRSGDATTGLFSPAVSTVAVATAGTERVRIDSSGNVGIGTTSPSTMLDINGGYGSYGTLAVGGNAAIGKSGSELGSLILFSTSGRNTTISMTNSSDTTITNTHGNINITPTANTLFTSGSVGIGTASPVSPLTLNTATTTATTIGAKENRLFFVNNSVTLNNGAEIVVGTGDTTTGRYAAIGTAIQANASGAAAGDVYIATKATGSTADTTLTPKLYVHAAGNVGIGTTAPTNKLTVIGGNIAAGGTGNTTGFTLQNWNIYEDASTSAYNIAYNAGTPFVTVSTSGNVGIGTTAPAAALDIIDASQTTVNYATPALKLEANVANGSPGMSFANSVYSEEWRVGLVGNGTENSSLKFRPILIRQFR